ncbi:MAG: hypothetical protein Ct9H300mP27_10070 [Chloroflexota bacterium]|nr:MAG: hypothetical protein Ct9H300mP27_10070 [Chloroflexota bacterium]
MLKSFFHSGFIVRDIETAIDFYTNVLGFQLEKNRASGAFIDQVLGFTGAHIKGAFVTLGEGHQLELIQYLSPRVRKSELIEYLGAAHIAFFVEDIDKFYNDKSAQGLSPINQPAEHRDDNGTLIRKVMYAQDPDGNWLEFVELL